jgi:hypothetical protein
VDSAATTLAQEFGIPVSVEDPPYIFRDDIKDVTAEVSRVANPQRRVLIPKGGRLEIRFALKADGYPQDLPGLLQNLITVANSRFPFAYRLDTDGTRFTIVPTRARDALGKETEATPLLDRRVSIPAGTRSIAATVDLVADALSAQTGLSVGCCQVVVAGVPWGMAEIAFEANNEIARNVLMRLIAAAEPSESDRAFWRQRCDPLPSTVCFINLAYATARSVQ